MRSSKGLYVVGGLCLAVCASQAWAQDGTAGQPAPAVLAGSAGSSGSAAVTPTTAPAMPVTPAPVTPEAPAPEPAAVPASPAEVSPAADPAPPRTSTPLAKSRRKPHHITGPVHAAAPDPERPEREEVERPNPSPFALRVGLGLNAALWLDGDDAQLWTPASFSLVAGYALDAELAIVARAASWLKFDELANEFYGAGVQYRFAGAMSVLATVGASFTRLSDFSRRLQGLAVQADVGQGFVLSEHWELVLGAHFQVGTPLGGSGRDGFSSIETGVFLAIDYL